MLFSDIKKILNIVKISGTLSDLNINFFTNNSKNVDKNTLYVVEDKKKIKPAYLKEIIDKKVTTLLTNKYFKDLPITQIIVKDVNKELIKLIKKNFPNQPKKSIAITGTNGKTSTAWFLAQICKLNNNPSKLIGTLGYFEDLKKVKNTDLTTPDYLDLYQFAYTKNKNINNFICEASSHGLAQGRFRNINIDIAAITNLSHDHLDYHKNFSSYIKAKFLLFTKILNRNGIAVINSRLKNYKLLKNKLLSRKIKIITYGSKDIYFKDEKALFLIIFHKKYLIKNLKLNDIQKENLECAIACAICMKISVKNIIKILHKLKAAPGRYETINYKKKLSKIIIDYAHTPDALEHILKIYTKNELKPSIVFGCGGDRDKLKRKEMAFIVNKFANKVFITDDNPRNENPSKIRKTIKKYCTKGIEIPDRRKAIHFAISQIKEKDILIIAGRGHEKYQLVNDKKIKFDDYEVVKKFLK